MKMPISYQLTNGKCIRLRNSQRNNNYDDYENEVNNIGLTMDSKSSNTTSQITHTYRLYAWIANETIIGNGETADYSIENWNKVFASIKVNVTGDFQDKKVQGVLYDIVKTGAVDDSNIDGNGTPIHFYEVNGENNGNGNFVRNNTLSDTYPIYYYRGRHN